MGGDSGMPAFIFKVKLRSIEEKKCTAYPHIQKKMFRNKSIKKKAVIVFNAYTFFF